MPRKVLPLTDIKCRNARPKSTEYKLADGNNLNLHVSPSGGKSWRLKYEFEGKAKSFTIGPYPIVSVARARELSQQAKIKIFEGLDPSGERKAQRLADKIAPDSSFEGLARDWHTRERKNTWSSDSHANRILRRFERDIFPYLGKRPITAITTPEILAVLRKIEERGALETAHRAKSNCSEVFKYARELGRCNQDPTAVMSRGALARPTPNNHAAIVVPEEIGQLLRAIKGYKGTAVVRAALQLAPLVFLRPGELRKAEWTEFDLNGSSRFPGCGPTWEVPNHRMKRSKEDKLLSSGHLVPLSRQAVQILSELLPLTGGGRYVFPTPRNPQRPLSDNGVLTALRRMGFTQEEMTGHGFRAMARTAITERLKFSAELVELQLAHAVNSPHGRAYDRTAFLEERTVMMQSWADYLDRLELA